MNNSLPINLAAPTSSNCEREVDFYRNPTELFRWINYRRWEGAQKRAISCPDEVKTWIVSNDPNTNAIQWRHLPLHLCCMQSQIPQSFFETLIRLYPEAAEMQDHEGRTPLHLACLNAGITQNVAMTLLCHNAAAAVTVDRNSRTPFDRLKQAISSIQVSAVPAELNSSAIILQRMEAMLTQIKQNVRLEETKRVDLLHASVSSERVASQQVISRLEEELAKTRQAMALLESDMNNKEELETNFEQKLIMITKENNRLVEETQNLRQTIKQLQNTIELEKGEIHRHDDIVSNVRQEYQKKIDELVEEVKNANAELATARSMSEALETQLKVKFSSEHAQIQKITSLEKNLSDIYATRNQIESEYKSKVDNLQRENSRLNESIESTTKYNNSLQDKVKELNDSLSNIVASQKILSTEQERLLEISETYVHETLAAVNAEHDRLMVFLASQQRQMEHLFTEQQRVLEAGASTGKQQQVVFETERERIVTSIQKMRQHFKEMDAAETNRRLQEAALRSSSATPLSPLSLHLPHSATNTTSPVALSPNDSSLSRSKNFKPRRGVNGTGGGKAFQSINPGNLSRVLERKIVEFSASESDESDTTSQDDETDYTADDQSASAQTVDDIEDKWSAREIGNKAMTAGANLSYSNFLVSRASNVVNGGSPLAYASALSRNAPSPSSSNEISHLSSVIRRNAPTFDTHGSTRKHVQYTEF